MKRISLIAVAVLLVIAFVLSGCAKPAPAPSPSPTPAPSPSPAPAQPVLLKFACPEPPEMADVTLIINPWLDRLEEASGGQIKIERHWTETLVALPDTYQAIVNGSVDMANFFPSMVPGLFDMDQVQQLPVMSVNCWRPSQVYWDLYQEFPEMQAQYKEVKYLWESTEIGSFPAMREPLKTLEDWKGRKLIASGSVVAIRYKSLGATPVPVPPLEVYSSLEKGVTDGIATPLKTLYAFKWGEVLKNVDLVPTGRMFQGFIMNMDRFNSLPPDVQKAIDDVNSQMPEICDKARWQIQNDALANLTKDFGVQFYTPPTDEVARWDEAAKSGNEEYAASLDEKGLPGTKLLEEYHNLSRKYAADEYALE